jgi:DNA-binding CsgD family transcriptional regulator
VLWAAVGFATLSVGGRLVWARGADALDVLGALLLAGGLTATVLPRSTTPATVRQPAAAPPVVPELSAREREVLALVAEGRTNREIGVRLGISPVTARNHVSRILTKLDLDNRTQAATWLARSRVEG